MKAVALLLLFIVAYIYCVPSCETYCDHMEANCNITNGGYNDRAHCESICEAFPAGLDADTSGNTLGCRVYHANAAAGDPDLHCPHASASGGGGSPSCGTMCEAYCNISALACGTSGANSFYTSYDFCAKACAQFSTTGTVATQAGTSLHCRIYHASVAILSPVPHCAHASFSGDGPCGTKCENYCELSAKTCTGTNTLFNPATNCPGFCATLPPGNFTDRAGNTVDCRIYHAVAAVGLSDAATHCPHASHASVDGVCSTTICDNYCDLALSVCTGVHELYATRTACMTACAAIPKTGLFSAQSGNNIQCRIYHLGAASALNDRATHCPHGSKEGGGVCGTTAPTANTETKGDAFAIIVSTLMLVVSMLF